MFESDVRTTLHPWILNSGFPERMHSTTQRLEWRAFRPSAFDGPRSIPMDFGQCGMLLEIVPVVLCGCYDSPACSFNDLSRVLAHPQSDELGMPQTRS